MGTYFDREDRRVAATPVGGYVATWGGSQWNIWLRESLKAGGFTHVKQTRTRIGAVLYCKFRPLFT